ncbi:hypothetical protein [Streptomyces sp. NPDC048248]|uniref:hypothetical protein n=1 Tax=Streptomyces sp. NPDC048248 TaxID=3365523 RepID=UPI0037208503
MAEDPRRCSQQRHADQGRTRGVLFADAHKAWTATRLIGGVASSGLSLPFGRKNKGAAAINITFADGTAKSYTVKPGPALGKANKYVTAFNALAAKSD